MSALLRLYPGVQVTQLALIVLSQITLVMLLAFAASFALRNRAASVRYGIWFAALVCLFLGPLGAWVADAAGLRLIALPLAYPESAEQATLGQVPAESDGSASALRPLSSQAFSESTPTNSARRGPVDSMRAAATAVFVIWCAGAGFLLFRLIYGLGVAGALRRSLRPIEIDGVEEVLRAVREALGTPSLPGVMSSPIVSSPISLGILKPVVVVPEDLLETMRPDELRDVLVHECAHVAQRDHIVGLLQRVAAMLFWLHPLLHKLNRELARAREEVCDDYVLRQGEPTRYARTLLALAERPMVLQRVPHGVGLLHSHWKLGDRIAGLLDSRRRPMTRLSGWVLITATFVFFTAGVLVAGCRLSDAHESEPIQPTVTELPEVTFADDEGRAQDKIVIEVKADGTYAIDGAACDAAALDKRLGAIASEGREVYISVRAEIDTDVVQKSLTLLYGLFEKHGVGMREFVMERVRDLGQ